MTGSELSEYYRSNPDKASRPTTYKHPGQPVCKVNHHHFIFGRRAASCFPSARILSLDRYGGLYERPRHQKLHCSIPQKVNKFL
jgi:hypothetical protein